MIERLASTWFHTLRQVIPIRMPPKYLRRHCRYFLRYYSDKWGHNTTDNKKPRRCLPPAASLRSRTRVNFRGMPAVKTDMASDAGDFCPHFGTVSQAVPAAISQVARRHMRTRRIFEQATLFLGGCVLTQPQKFGWVVFIPQQQKVVFKFSWKRSWTLIQPQIRFSCSVEVWGKLQIGVI